MCLSVCVCVCVSIALLCPAYASWGLGDEMERKDENQRRHTMSVNRTFSYVLFLVLPRVTTALEGVWMQTQQRTSMVCRG